MTDSRPDNRNQQQSRPPGSQPQQRKRRPSNQPSQSSGPQENQRQKQGSQSGVPQGGQPGPRGKLRVIPLGGVNEVGKNMMVVQYEHDLIIIDCGAMFPEEDLGGLDLIVPDVKWVKQRLGNLRGIVITHGHEDHIGGLPYVLRQLAPKKPIPLYAPPLALGLIEAKLLEHRMEKMVELINIDKQPIHLGKLSVEYIRVTHSIPDANAVVVRSPAGIMLDTGDFKFDQTPVMGKPSDLEKLKRIGDEGVLVLLSDTTRVETPGSTPSEQVVMETIDRMVAAAEGQVILASFASNVSRLEMALRAAEKHGRKVAVAGRSMEQSSRVARELEYIAPRDGLLIDLDAALKLPRNQRLLVVTGSQGEPEAALARIAANDHKKIRVTTGDVVIISASPIPGNEVTVSRTIDNLFRRGATVVYNTLERGVHVSGHAARDELKQMISLTRPKYIVPIHGQYRHFVLYRELCKSMGIPAERVLLPETGSILEFSANGGGFHGKVESGSVMVDRHSDRDRSGYTLRGEHDLTDDGLVVVTIVLKRLTGEILAGPDLVTRGLPREINETVLKEIEGELRKFLERQPKSPVEHGFVTRRTKEIVGRGLARRMKTHPLILQNVTSL